MPFEADAKEIEIFAFVPVGGWPDRDDAVDHRIAPAQPYFQPQSFAPIEREKVVIHLEARLEREAIHGSDVREEREPQGRLAGQIFSSAQQVLARDDDRRLAPEIDYFGDRLGVPLPQFMHHWILVSKL